MSRRNGNVSCIEALIQASNHETNDDDVDGRTPLLLACLHGHHQAVQVLLSLGGDVTKRFELQHETYQSSDAMVIIIRHFKSGLKQLILLQGPLDWSGRNDWEKKVPFGVKQFRSSGGIKAVFTLAHMYGVHVRRTGVRRTCMIV